MLPPEFLAEVAVAVCRGGFGGLTPEGLGCLAELTDRQIVEILCKPSSPAEGHSVRAAPIGPIGPQTEEDEYAQFMAMGEMLMRTKGPDGKSRAQFTRDEMQRHWDTRKERSRTRGHV